MIAWRKFVKYAKARYSYKTIPYFAVFEATKAGQPHLHILCRVKWIDQGLLSNFMRRAIEAPIVDIRRCNSSRARAAYVTKYLGKAPHKFGTCKRYWQTQDYTTESETDPVENRFQGGNWRIVNQHIDDLLLHHTVHHHRIDKCGPIWIISSRAPP